MYGCACRRICAALSIAPRSPAAPVARRRLLSRRCIRRSIMNYRHIYHAGNFADVFKHAILARLLTYLTRKEAALRFMDTHAGIGRYDLTSGEAQRAGEWRDGVARLRRARPPAEVAALLAPYLDALGPLDEQGRPKLYPGSPALAQMLLRPQDRIALSELHPEDRGALVVNMGRDRR